MSTTPIIIVSYNTLRYTQRTIESILVQSHRPLALPYQLIVVDNGSTDGTVEYLEGLGEAVEAIYNRDNQGWIKGVNQGLRRALEIDCAWLIFANSDVVVPEPWWLHRYDGLFQEEEAIGAVGPTSNFVMGLQKYEFNDRLPAIHETKFLIGFFMAIRREVLERVGLLDERFGMGGNDDLDLSIRIRLAGWKLMINRRAFILHYGSRTLLPYYEGWKGIAEQDKRTRRMLIEKWGEEVVNELFVLPEELRPYPKGDLLGVEKR